MSPTLLARTASILALSLLCIPALAADVTTETLLDDMFQLGRLCEMPSSAYKTVQFSSYDRRAEVPDGPGWFSNADGFGREPIPGVLRTIREADASGVGVYVLAECEGPGAIVRCWSAARHRTWYGMNGEIRLYLDGAKEPVFTGTARDFLIDLYAALARQHGLSEEGLTDGFTQRDACYCPIPFAKGCRIEWTGKLSSVHFYHIELREYEPGTQVETFQPKTLDALRPKLKQVGAVLADPSLAKAPADTETAPFTLELAPGQKRSVVEVQGRPGRIARFQAKVDADDLDAALRQTVLLITFDNHARPQVESPLGDFFGAAPGINPYDSIPMKVQPDGTMLCRFEMPFADAVDVRIENRGPKPVGVTGKVEMIPEKWDPKRSCHFYARWRVNHEMQVNGREGFDIPFLIAQGQGRFVGASVHLMNPDPVPSCSWWGEGDEKIFVDDDGDTPSFFGTGSEDYFNYSWSEADLFQHAYFAQPRCDGSGTRGFVVNNRWHILDDIPFYKSISFYMEMIHHHVIDGFSYARISYYYARPGTRDDQMPIFREDLRRPEAPRNWEPSRTSRQAQATYYHVSDLKPDPALIDKNPRWARGEQILWRPKKPGDSITFDFDVKKAGKYRMSVVTSHTPTAGICEVFVNGKKTRSFDTYTPFFTMEREHGLGTLDLKQGKNEIRFVSRGKNDKSAGSNIGVDFMWIQP